MSDIKLNQDLSELAAMASEMDDYIMSDVLFWKMGSQPMLTLGGYLMRQHRILALADALDPAQLQLLNTAVSQFTNALHERIVRFETKAHREIEARMRQWNEFLIELEKEPKVDIGVYRNAVEARMMLAVLIDKLQSPPYKLESRVLTQLDLLDRQLRRLWQPGEFIFDKTWQKAYPEEAYWYLYGLPG